MYCICVQTLQITLSVRTLSDDSAWSWCCLLLGLWHHVAAAWHHEAAAFYVAFLMLIICPCRKCSVKVDRNIKEIHSPAVQKDLLTLEEQEVSVLFGFVLLPYFTDLLPSHANDNIFVWPCHGNWQCLLECQGVGIFACMSFSKFCRHCILIIAIIFLGSISLLLLLILLLYYYYIIIIILVFTW